METVGIDMQQQQQQRQQQCHQATARNSKRPATFKGGRVRLFV